MRRRDRGEKGVIVLATTDETAIVIACSILDDEGIEYAMGGGGLRKFGGATFLGANLGPFMGQAHIKVSPRLAIEAAELLQGLSGAILLNEDGTMPGPAI